MNIVYASDDNYAQLAGVSMLSLFENNKDVDVIDVFILDNGISEENKEHLLSIANTYFRCIKFIKVVDIENILNMQLYTGTWSITAYARLFIGSLLPDNVKRVIYIDCDTIVMGSLASLWNDNINNFIVGGVADYRLKTLLRAFCIRTNIYVNSGVMLIDLERWRALDVEKRFVKYISFYSGYLKSVDEQVVNGVLQRYIKPIHPKYNYEFGASDGRYSSRKMVAANNYTKDQYNDTPIIFHFSGKRSNRPWIEGNHHPIYQEVYMKYREMTPWAGYPLMKPPNESRIKRYIRKKIHSLPDPLLFRYLEFQYFREGFKYYLYSRKRLKESEIKIDDCILKQINNS